MADGSWLMRRTPGGLCPVAERRLVPGLRHADLFPLPHQPLTINHQPFFINHCSSTIPAQVGVLPEEGLAPVAAPAEAGGSPRPESSCRRTYGRIPPC